MKLKGIKRIALQGLVALLLIVAIVAMTQAPVIPQAPVISAEPLDLGISRSLVAADILGSEARVVGRLELRPFAEGLRLDEVKAIRADVIEKAIAMGLLNEGGLEAKAELTPDDFEDPKMAVVAYGFVIGPDGVPWEYLADTNCKAVGTLHQCSQKEFEEELRRCRQVEVTTASSWDARLTTVRTRTREPIGRIRQRLVLYRALNDNDPYSEHFTLRQCVRTTPGYTLWNNDWRTNRLRGVHIWSTPFTVEWMDWGPQGVISLAATGWVPITVRIHSIVACINDIMSWTFPKYPATTLVADPNCITMEGPWTKTYAHGSTASKVMTRMEPGSAVRTLPPPNTWMRLIRVRANARFRDPWVCWLPWGADYRRLFAPSVTIRVRNYEEMY